MATDVLDVEISGSGSVTYNGESAGLQEISGSGQLIKVVSQMSLAWTGASLRLAGFRKDFKPGADPDDESRDAVHDAQQPVSGGSSMPPRKEPWERLMAPWNKVAMSTLPIVVEVDQVIKIEYSMVSRMNAGNGNPYCGMPGTRNVGRRHEAQSTQDRARRWGGSLLEQQRQRVASPTQLLTDHEDEDDEVEDRELRRSGWASIRRGGGPDQWQQAPELSAVPAITYQRTPTRQRTTRLSSCLTADLPPVTAAMMIAASAGPKETPGMPSSGENL